MYSKQCGVMGLFVVAGLLAGTIAPNALGGKLDAMPRDVNLMHVRPYIIIERGEILEATQYLDGRKVMLESGVVWRPFCGSDLKELTPRRFEDLVTDAINTRPKGEQHMPSGAAPRGANFVFNVTNSPGAAANAAIAAVESFYENLLQDPITVTINVRFLNMGSGVLGATGSSFIQNVSYTTIRNSLQANMDADDYIESQLPPGSTVPVRFNGNSATVTNVNVLDVNTAPYKAFIGTLSGANADMDINTAISWDWDPSNGVGGSQYDFQAVFVHEIGHALGFTSAADYTTPFMELLDLYRFQRTDGTGNFNPDTVAQFTTTARLVHRNTPNDDHNSVFYNAAGVETEYRMSDGNPDQASHFREQSPTIGTMDPILGNGETYYPTVLFPSDLRVFDAIGWDIVDEGGTTTLPFFDDFPTTTINTSKWTGNEGCTIDNGGSGEPSGTLSLHLDGADVIRSAIMNTASLTGVFVSYWWQKTGNGQSPEPGEDLVFDYYNSSNTWVEFARQFATGPNGQPYAFARHVLTGDALHSNFRIRIRSLGNDASDDWYVDDVGVDAPASNDLCSSAILLSPAIGSHPISNNFGISNGTSESCTTFESDVWYRIIVSCNSTLELSICDADFDAQLAVYGAGCPGSPNQALACSEDSCGDGPFISMPVTSGVYRLRVGGRNGEQGTGTLVINCVADPTGACCFNDGSCSVTTSASCNSSNGVYQGNDTFCSPNPCPQPTGACCFSDGSCSQLTLANCSSANGNYEGNDTNCSPNPCPQPSGACCFSDGSCSQLTLANCNSANGNFEGNDTNCSPNPCPQPSGACCFSDGSCSELTLVNCSTANGNYEGNGTNCSPNPCPQPSGACCYSDGTCTEVRETSCNTGGGVYQGNGTDCAPNPCPQPTGACCLTDGSCNDNVTVADCEVAGGIYQGDTLLCSSVSCPQPCPADLVPPGGDGHVTIADITAVLTAYGLPCNNCPEDIAPPPSGDGQVSIADINAVLAAFGPCPGN